MGDLMDNLEDRTAVADDRNEKRDTDWEIASAERGDEKPAVEPYDPYFGRKTERFSWL
jgi:hypothetical protein